MIIFLIHDSQLLFEIWAMLIKLWVFVANLDFLLGHVPTSRISLQKHLAFSFKM